MKPNKVSLIVLCMAVMLINQKVLSQSSGLIRYEEKTDVHKSLPPEMAEMKKQIPRYSVAIFRLYFNSDESIYMGFESDQPVEAAGGGAGVPGGGAPRGGGGGRSGGGPPGGGSPPGGSPPSGARPGGAQGGPPGLRGSSIENQIYTGNHKIVAQMVSLRKYYFMSDSLKMPDWKFGLEKKKIRGYECSVASYVDLSDPDKPEVITAWFTPEIRPLIGPERFNTLPGGVLELDINDGEHSWVAKKVELRSLKDSEKIEAPVARNNSIWTTYERYKKAQEEQMNQMKSGGRGR